MVIDAKFKPRYHYSEPDIEDIQQISAYARMEGVYKKSICQRIGLSTA